MLMHQIGGQTTTPLFMVVSGTGYIKETHVRCRCRCRCRFCFSCCFGFLVEQSWSRVGFVCTNAVVAWVKDTKLRLFDRFGRRDAHHR